MKKTLVILSALVALVACSKVVPVVEEPMQNDNEEINLNITITRSEINDNTKASVKAGWANNDVVFVFFSGVAAPKYLELKYNSSTSKWVATRKKTGDEKLSLEDIASASTLTALYMPYGSQLNVFGTAGSKREFNRSYHGHFYSAENQGYTWDPDTQTLTSTISLAVHAPSDGEKLLHFDVEGLDTSKDYYNVLYDGESKKMSRYFLQHPHMKPLTTNGVNTDGTVAIINYDFGKEIEGYIDPKGFVSFSGVLESSAVGEGNAVDYDFVIYDRIAQKYYYRDDIGKKTISKNMYIGLGDVTKHWKIKSGQFFSVGQAKYVEFSPANLVLNITSVPEGGGEPTAYTWSFHENQYDFVGADPESQSGNNGTYNNLTGHGTFATTGRLDSFGWVGASSTVLKGDLTRYGVSNSMLDTDYGSIPGESLMSDWGSNSIKSADGKTTYDANYWRTPTISEWEYLFKKRIQASQKYGFATVCGVKGILLVPDLFVDPVRNEADGSGGKYVPRDINKTGWNRNVYTGEGWAAMETAGAIFLPVTYYRDGNTIGRIFHAEPNGFYNSSTAVEGTTNRYYIQFGPTYDGTIKDAVRASGLAVRLIHDMN